MANAKLDGNHVPTILAVLNSDTIQGTNLVPIAINGTNNGLKIDTTSTISFIMQPIDSRDQNYVGCWLFEGTDGKTYPAVANSSGGLLIAE